MIDDVHVSVSGHQIGLDDRGINTSALDRDSLVIVMVADNVEVKASGLVVGFYQGNLQKRGYNSW